MNDQKNKRCSYKKITQQIRQTIIERILKGGQNIKDVSAEMNINISTCKAILKVYQEEGRIGKKKKRNKVINLIETFSFYCINGSTIEQIGDLKIQESKTSIKRNQNIDRILEDNAKQKAEKILTQVIEAKKKKDQTAAEMQRHFFQLQFMQNQLANQNNNSNYFPFTQQTQLSNNLANSFNYSYTPVKQEEMMGGIIVLDSKESPKAQKGGQTILSTDKLQK